MFLHLLLPLQSREAGVTTEFQMRNKSLPNLSFKNMTAPGNKSIFLTQVHHTFPQKGGPQNIV